MLGGVANVVTRDRPATVPLAITAIVIGVTLGIATMIILWRGGSAHRSTSRPAAGALAGGPSAEEVRPPELHEATRWVDGLTAGLILPSDVTSRLAVQDPRSAKAVVAAWSDMSSIPRPTGLHEAARWVDGLAAGLILPSDVTSRLAVRDPGLAKAVMAAWSDLSRLGVE